MIHKNNKNFNKLRTEFLPEALEIVEKPVSPLGNGIIYIVFLIMVAFLIWACFGKIDEVALARGKIKSVEGVQEVQSSGNGIVTKINVKEGDSVKKGDVLYSMDKEIEKINIDYSEGKAGLLQLRVELLDQLLLGKDIKGYKQKKYNKEQLDVVDYMITLSESGDLSLAEYEITIQNAKNQYNLAKKGLTSITYKEEYLNKQKEIQKETEKKEMPEEIELEVLEDNYNYLKEQANKYKELYEVGAKAKAEWDEIVRQRDNAKKQIDIKKLEIKEKELTKSSNELTSQYEIDQNSIEYNSQELTIVDAKDNYDKAVVNYENAKSQRDNKLIELKEQYQDELKQYGITMVEQYYEYGNKNIVALYDGVVKTLAVDKEGAVISTTQVVAEILPDSSQYIVDAEINNSDIGFIEVGQAVDVKIDTYDYQKYGKLNGTVVYVSPDAIENEKQEQVYKASILLEGDEIKQNEGLEITQGMECSVEIKTDRKRIIEFFLEPLAEALDNSLNIR